MDDSGAAVTGPDSGSVPGWLRALVPGQDREMHISVAHVRVEMVCSARGACAVVSDRQLTTTGAWFAGGSSLAVRPGVHDGHSNR